MIGKRRFLNLLVSVSLHMSLAGALYAFSTTNVTEHERIYSVSLTEMMQPAAPVAEAAPVIAGAPEPVAELAPEIISEPVVEPAKPEPETKKITAKKKERVVKKKETPLQPVAQPVTASSTETAQAAGGKGGPAAYQAGGYREFNTDQLDQPLTVASRAVPVYPNKARRMNVEGEVIVAVVVDTSGTPKNCSVQSANPPGYFESAAIKAAKSTRFIPGKVKGQPVNTRVIMPFRFELNS